MCIPSNLQCNVENAKNFHHVLLLTRTGSFCLINTILLHYCEFCSLSSTTKHQMVLVMFARNTCLWILWKKGIFSLFLKSLPIKLPLQKTLLLLLQYANFFKEGLRKVPKNWKTWILLLPLSSHLQTSFSHFQKQKRFMMFFMAKCTLFSKADNIPK